MSDEKFFMIVIPSYLKRISGAIPVRRRRLACLSLAALFLCFLQTPAWSLTPNEVILLVNKNSLDSVGLANEYSKLRGIPQSNLLYLDLPRHFQDPAYYISRREFTDYLWTPFHTALKERGMEQHVFALLLSAGFPNTIAGSPPRSVQAGFYYRNKFPNDEMIKSGKGVSNIFSGEVEGQELWKGTFSLDRYVKTYGAVLPLPCVSIAHTGARGNSVSELVKMYKAGVVADSHAREGEVLFLKGTDVRSKAREWQYPWAVSQMSGKLRGKITNTWKTNKRNIVGVMAGLAELNTSDIKPYLVPGALAGHLTSWGARFEEPGQTKISEWISSGASGTCGTVTEPYAIWTKFPHASLFLHYMAGACMLESYYQSIALPVQSYVYGDALARPFAPNMELRLQQRKTPQGVKVAAAVRGVPEGRQIYYQVYINGEKVQDQGRSPLWDIPNNKLSKGPLQMRVYAMSDGSVAHFAKADIQVSGTTTAPELLWKNEETTAEDYVDVQLTSLRPAERFEVFKGAYSLGLVEGGDSLRIPKQTLGWGASSLQAVGEYRGGQKFYSKPLWVKIPYRQKQNDFQLNQGKKNGHNIIAAEMTVASGLSSWSRLAWGMSGSLSTGGWVKRLGEGYALQANKSLQSQYVKTPVDDLAGGFLAEIQWAGESGFVDADNFFILFNRGEAGDFCCLYLDGKSSSLRFAQVKKWKWDYIDIVGYPFRLGEKYLLSIHRDGEGLVGSVNGHALCKWDSVKLNRKGFAVGASGTRELTVHHMGVLFPQETIDAWTGLDSEVRWFTPRIQGDGFVYWWENGQYLKKSYTLD